MRTRLRKVPASAKSVAEVDKEDKAEAEKAAEDPGSSAPAR